MKSYRIILATTALSLTLSGCSFFRGLAHFDRGSTAQPALAAGNNPFTDDGRKALAADEYGLAIQQFQSALAAGETKAPALNGLGVAFAKLGRFDLAERYFQGAMAVAPEEARYRENLARLMTSPAYAMRHDADRVQMAGLDPAAAAPADAAAQPRMAGAAPAEPAAPAPRPALAAGQLERVGAHQFFIRSAAPQSAPSAAVASRVDKGFKPQVRVALGSEGKPRADKTAGTGDLANFRAVVRVALPEAKAGQ